MLNIFHNKTHFLTMKKLLLSPVRHTRDLRPGMRIVFRWNADDHLNDNPEWGRIMIVENTYNTIAKLVIQIDTAYEVNGVITDNIVYYVHNNQYASYWCVYDVVGENIDIQEGYMKDTVIMSTASSDIYAALLQHEWELM